MKKSAPLPSIQDIVAYIQSRPDVVNRRDIAKAFGLKGQERVALKELLKELNSNSDVCRQGKRYSAVKPVEILTVKIHKIISRTEIEVSLIEDETQIFTLHAPPQKVYEMAEGEHIIVKKGGNILYFVRSLSDTDNTLIGVYHHTDSGNYITSVARKDRLIYIPIAPLPAGLQHEDLVEIRPCASRNSAQNVVEILQIIGSLKEPKSLGLIAIHEHNLPHEFSLEALAQAEQASVPLLEEREDLRGYPLVTIDDEDARDFDDAIWAEPDTDPTNLEGWHLIVAIADVSFYVHPNDALDKEAYQRGNSIYFPDRVIPMLPEALSNNLCSLRPKEDRACLAVHLWITRAGKIRRHSFVRGLMNSVERLTYRETQQAIDGEETRLSKEFIDDVIRPLYGAFTALKRGKLKRSPLNLDLPEERIYLDEQGKITKITPRARFDSHRLIEEFMIMANVAAAITLSDTQTLCMYRVHDQPTSEKFEALREFVKGAKIYVPKGQAVKTRIFNYILSKAAGTPYEDAVNQLVLRTQAQAVYQVDNIGHFGLHLPRYTHFTSPIRRYADLLVHRGLIAALKMPKGDEFKYTLEDYNRMAQHISFTERRAAMAERDTLGRYIAAYLAEHKEEVFSAHIVGVTDFALFVRLDDTGADGMIPVRNLGTDFFIHDKVRQQLVGRRTKHAYVLGSKIQVTLVEADAIKGNLQFSPVISSIPKRKSFVPTKKKLSKKAKALKKESIALKKEKKTVSVKTPAPLPQ